MFPRLFAEGRTAARPSEGNFDRLFFLAFDARAAVGAHGFRTRKGHFCAASGAVSRIFAFLQGGVFVERDAVSGANVADYVTFFKEGVDLVAHFFFGQTELRGEFAHAVKVFFFDGGDEPYVSAARAIGHPADRASVKRTHEAGDADRPHGGLTDPQAYAEQYAAEGEQEGQNHRECKHFFCRSIYGLHNDLLCCLYIQYTQQRYFCQSLRGKIAPTLSAAGFYRGI